MSDEIVIIAVLPVAEGKMPRLREFMKETMNWIEKNEPGTLEFQTFEDGEKKLMILERYKDQKALEAHQGSDNYKKVFEIMSNEGMMGGEPTITQGTTSDGFRR